MPWVRLEDDFADHPKLVAAGPLAMALQVAALCYCNKHLTNGVVPEAKATQLINLDGTGVDAKQLVKQMLEHGLWEVVEGGYFIHDYFDYQPSREEVLAEREAKKAAGRKGGKASAQARVKAHPQAPASADGQAEGQAKLKPVPVPVPYIEEDEEERAREDEETPTQAIISGWQQGTKESGKNASAGCLVLDLLLERAEEGWEPDLLRELARESATKNMPRRWAETVLPNLAHANVRTLADYRNRLARSHNKGAPKASQTIYPDLTERYRDVLGGG